MLVQQMRASGLLSAKSPLEKAALMNNFIDKLAATVADFEGQIAAAIE